MKTICPICRQKSVLEGNPHRPFCSERCRLLDLEAWMSGRYRVPVEQEPHEGQESDWEDDGASTNGSP